MENKKIDFVVITDEMLKDNECKELFFVSKVYTELNNFDFRYRNKLEWSMVNCESPIEQLLAIYMCDIGLDKVSQYTNDAILIGGINNQYDLNISGIPYRADFCISVIYKEIDFESEFYKWFIIECDGHDFHEKTKTQVAKDKKRERDIIQAGYIVIRFSGSEIYSDPKKCAIEILNIIKSNSPILNPKRR